MKNPTDKLHVLYIFNMDANFYASVHFLTPRLCILIDCILLSLHRSHPSCPLHCCWLWILDKPSIFALFNIYINFPSWSWEELNAAAASSVFVHCCVVYVCVCVLAFTSLTFMLRLIVFTFFFFSFYNNGGTGADTVAVILY